MIGVIAGDVIGSVHEHARRKSTDFPLFDPLSRFTDDTVLTVATAHAILTGIPYAVAYREFGRQHPDAGYGGSFYGWLFADEPRAIRLAISLGGDADTQAAIAGGIAEAFYKHVPDAIVLPVMERLAPRFVEVIDAAGECDDTAAIRLYQAEYSLEAVR